MLIRTFRNDDLLQLHRLWGEHWKFAGLTSQCSVRQLEQGILSRIFFEPKDLLVAAVDGHLVGWLHRSKTDEVVNTLVIPTVVAGAGNHGLTRAAILKGLLEAAISEATTAGARVQPGVGDDMTHGYGGMDPLGPGVGVLESDRDLLEVAEEIGLMPTCRFTLLEASVADFRFPMNRDFMQLRRITQTRYTVSPVGEGKRAQAASHLDPKRISLIGAGGIEKCHLNFYLSDQHAEVMQPYRCMVRLDRAMQEEGMDSEALYLLASLVRDAASHQLRYVDLTVEADGERFVIDQLRSLQFKRVRTGAIWVKETVS